jgi:hypothetical protein
MTMADMPAYAPGNPPDEAGDDEFADAVAGNVGAGAGRQRPRGTGNALAGLARNQLLGLAEGGKLELLRNIVTIAGIVREVTTQVQSLGVEPFAGYATQAADLVDDLHDMVRDKSVEALVEDGRDLVRRQPEIAIAAAVILGFIGARIVKARS